MPNATCFLIAYALVLLLEVVRWKPKSSTWDRWIQTTLLFAAAVAWSTHTLYLLDRIFIGVSNSKNWSAISWHDWSVFAAWFLAVIYGALLVRRGDSRTGVFILPLVLLFVGGSIALPPSVSIESQTSATGWRLAHGVGMVAGSVLVSLGFAMALMYFLHASKLKSKKPLLTRFPLPSLEYLQSMGRMCLLGSAASIGFGMVAGVIMNLTQDGRVEWLDRGILFSGGLFLWLVFASACQRQLSRRGSGHATAWMNILSFAIVVVAVLLVLSTPHGGNKSNESFEIGKDAQVSVRSLRSVSTSRASEVS